jgi:hypothetical protein
MRDLYKGLLCLTYIMAISSLTLGCLDMGTGEESGTTVVISPEPVDPDTYSCNPTEENNSNIGQTNQGIQGQLFYLEDSQPRYSSVADYMSYGTFVDEVFLYFDRLHIPTRPFDRGFELASGQVIQNTAGNTLYEYFAIRFNGRLQLSPNQTPGLYQVAVLADDGATLSMDYGNGLQTLVDNDGTHPTKMMCASEPIELNAGDKIPFQLDYFQGPRFHISLVLLIRPWSDATVNDPLCNKSGNGLFFDSNQNPPAPTASYNALLSRGWAPIEKESYLLPNATDTNPCNEPAPVITNFRTQSISANSILVAWDTDRSSTSQVSYRTLNGTVNLTDNNGAYTTSHSVLVSGLTANTQYHLKASSASSSGQTSESSEIIVRTRR